MAKKTDPRDVYERVLSFLGEIGIVYRGDGRNPRIRRIILPLEGMAMTERIRREFPGARPAPSPAEITDLIRRFLAGEPVDFSRADLDLEGMSDFQRRALTTCRGIPRSRVMTYGQLAAAVGTPGGARAVGNAMALNPFPLIIPCHRVIRSGGGLGGFGGGHSGLAMKKSLLALEEVAFDGRGRIRPEHLL
jgi:methylated-DNA-[protein]-cysteine S-methyltransferase